MQLTEKDFLKSYKISDYPVPLTTVDIAIFSIIDKQLNILLLKRDNHPEKDKLALPGGFVDLENDSNLEATAKRKLQEKTGVKLPYLEQVESIGSQKRDPRGWSITILYFALMDINKFDSKLRDNSAWYPIEETTALDLAFDHKQLLAKAVNRLRNKALYTALPMALLPKKFTLTELKTIFEIILDKDLPVKSFRRRMIDAEAVLATDESKISGKRSAQLYRANGIDKDFHFPRPLQD